MTTTPKPEPASDEQLKIWQERPCGDTQCRCTELHLDQAIARIEADRARIREQAEEIERLRSLLYSSKPWPIAKPEPGR